MTVLTILRLGAAGSFALKSREEGRGRTRTSDIARPEIGHRRLNHACSSESEKMAMALAPKAKNFIIHTSSNHHRR